MELIEIDCGHNGKPLYIHGPSESDARTRQIIAQLDRTAGPGNYTIIDEADWDQELDEDDEDDENEWVDELDEEIQLNLQTKSPGLQFKVQIEGIYNPPVWRRLIVPSHYSFRLFHEIIQNTFNWWSEHLYAFSPGGWNSSPQIMEIDEEEDNLGMGKKMESTETPLSEYFNKKGEKFHYIYDFGDNWDHLITLEKILEEEISQPCCTGGEGLCPPEDCGGIPGYENLKIALANPAHPEHEELKDWLGLDEEETWDPADFELEEVQELLADLFTLDPKPNLNNN